MESIQMIKSRVKGISSTRQITQSMRLVASAKVQRSRSRMLENRLFADEAANLAANAASGWSEGHHRYLHGHREPADRQAIVILSGDRGLCGGYNINVAKEAFRFLEGLSGEHMVVAVGAKAADYVRRQHVEVAQSFTGVSESPLYDDAREIADLLLSWYDESLVDAVYLSSTKFQSMLAQTPRTERLLPLDPGEGRAIGGTVIRFEQDATVLLDQAVAFSLTARIYMAMLEAACCEQSARITSMDSAVKNADDMIESLSLRFNQARQGAITNEIIEIVSGASAVRTEGD